jgi:hypothetical protein
MQDWVGMSHLFIRLQKSGRPGSDYMLYWPFRTSGPDLGDTMLEREIMAVGTGKTLQTWLPNDPGSLCFQVGFLFSRRSQRLIGTNV